METLESDLPGWPGLSLASRLVVSKTIGIACDLGLLHRLTITPQTSVHWGPLRLKLPPTLTHVKSQFEKLSVVGETEGPCHLRLTSKP